MKLMLRVFAVLALIALAVPASHAQTIIGAQAQKSPQADAFLAYENDVGRVLLLQGLH